MAMKDLKNATITIEDGGTKSVVLKLGSGNVSWTEHLKREYMLDRGKLGLVRNGDEAPVDVSFEAWYEFYTSTGGSGTDPTIPEILRGTYGMTPAEATASGYVSVDADGCQPYACKITVEDEPICLPAATGSTETLVFDMFRVEELKGDWKTGIEISPLCQ